MRSILAALAFLSFSFAVVQADNWPQWRGPSLNGISNEKNLPVKWTAEENIAWKLALRLQRQRALDQVRRCSRTERFTLRMRMA